MKAAAAFWRAAWLAAPIAFAACGEPKEKTLDPFSKPSPTVAFAYEGRTLDQWAAHVSDKDPTSRRDAAFALGAFGPEAADAVEALAPLLRDADADLRWTALVAVERIGVAPPAVAAGVVAALVDPQPSVKRAAHAAILRLGASVLDALVASLRVDDWAVQSAAADALGAMGAAAVPALRKVLSDPSSDTAALAARALATMGPAAAAAIPDLVKCLGRQGTARLSSIDALAAIGQAARPALETALKDPDERVQSAAQAALDRIPR